jgi:hypothetical protein
MARAAAVTVRLEKGFHKRLKAKLAAEGTTLQAKAQALFEEYVDGPPEKRDEISRQVAIARKLMKRYEPALRELAR